MFSPPCLHDEHCMDDLLQVGLQVGQRVQFINYHTRYTMPDKKEVGAATELVVASHQLDRISSARSTLG